MRPMILALAAIATTCCAAQDVSSCNTVYIERMPEAMDKFISAELIKWGGMKIVTIADKADTQMTYGRERARVDVTSTGSVTVPRETTIQSERTDRSLPSSPWGLTTAKSAAVEIVHRKSDVVVWAGSASDSWSWSKGPKKIAQKIVKQLKHDFKSK